MNKTHMTIARTTLALLALLALLAMPAVHARDMRALIVGVSEYPNLEKALWLEGPRNDAARMQEILQRRGFAANRISVLADGVPHAGLPTRANILNELDRLAREAGKDDLVLLYFAGHGSQQPVSRNTPDGTAESDGLYEIFLPRDVGKWSGQQGRVENALIKTELRDAVDRILAKGAFVWGVFDSCHSATLVRSADSTDSGVRYRYVDPVQLGVPSAAMTAAREHHAEQIGKLAAAPAATVATVATTARGPGAETGGSAFFYAAQTTEETPEMQLPQGQADGKPYGLFGYMITQALDSGVPMTYRQMAQYVLTRYGAMNQTRVTPLFSGTALDQPVLGQNTALVQQWKIDRRNDIVVQAGALSRLSEGSILAVVSDPLAKTEAAIGYVKLTRVSLSSAVAEPLDYKGKPALKPEALPKSAYARIVQIAPRYTLRASIDSNNCATQCGPATSATSQLRNKTDTVPGASVTWLDAPAESDIIVRLLPDRILLLPPLLAAADCTATDACPQVLTLLADPAQKVPDKGLRQKLAESLHAIARSINLLRIATQLAETGRKAAPVEVAMKLTSQGKQMPYAPEQVPQLHAGDRISVSLRNNGITAVDVTMLYVDAHYGINVLFPSGGGASNRLEPWAVHDFDIDITDDTLGMERMLTIAVNAAKGQERSDFSFLAQPSLSTVRGTKGTDDDNDDVLAFMDAGFSSYRSRGESAAARAPGDRTSMQVFTFNIAK
jgi:hypothetical protein